MTNEIAITILESLYPAAKQKEQSNMIDQAIHMAIIALNKSLAKDVAEAPDMEEAQDIDEDV